MFVLGTDIRVDLKRGHLQRFGSANSPEMGIRQRRGRSKYTTVELGTVKVAPVPPNWRQLAPGAAEILPPLAIDCGRHFCHAAAPMSRCRPFAAHHCGRSPKPALLTEENVQSDKVAYEMGVKRSGKCVMTLERMIRKWTNCTNNSVHSVNVPLLRSNPALTILECTVYRQSGVAPREVLHKTGFLPPLATMCHARWRHSGALLPPLFGAAAAPLPPPAAPKMRKCRLLPPLGSISRHKTMVNYTSAAPKCRPSAAPGGRWRQFGATGGTFTLPGGADASIRPRGPLARSVRVRSGGRRALGNVASMRLEAASTQRATGNREQKRRVFLDVDVRWAPSGGSVQWKSHSGHWVAAHGSPSAIPYADTPIDTPWPCDVDEYADTVAPAGSGAGTVARFLSGLDMEGFSALALLSKASILMERAITFSTRYSGHPDAHAFDTLDAILQQLTLDIPLGVDMELSGVDGPKRSILMVTQSLAHAAIIRLHAHRVHTSDTSRSKYFAAARAVVRIINVTDWSQWRHIDPIMGILWTIVCEVFIAELTTMQSFGVVGRLYKLSQQHQDVSAYLETILTTMRNFANTSPLIVMKPESIFAHGEMVVSTTPGLSSHI
ncbi:hypothetical protein GGX14DRAFT_588013 [Mycena pura]|uniref:Uncharacterized protein n=1 Tax=Mycena pura TaxID=153505 RepID=A0AAD6Y6M2_9AGAR|nr:hypothetical protein GGX14DRAFT_588013 [Mycena pura]